MKRNNKKGFTIVELVIVIAVIAILSAVLIPTFGGIIGNANRSAAQQEAYNLYKDHLATSLVDGVIDDNELTVTTDGYTITIDENGDLQSVTHEDYTFTVANNAITKVEDK